MGVLNKTNMLLPTFCTEIEWTSKVYDIEACGMWKEQVVQEQLRV